MHKAPSSDGVTSLKPSDDLTVQVTFDGPTPNPYGPFVGGESPRSFKRHSSLTAWVQKHLSVQTRTLAQSAQVRLLLLTSASNDVIQLVANQNYREPSKPAFATVTFKGGGDATAAGRAVMETGEFDYAWNLQLAPDVIASNGRRRHRYAGVPALVHWSSGSC